MHESLREPIITDHRPGPVRLEYYWLRERGLNMNKSELVDNISQKANVTLGKAEDLVEIFFSSITKALNEGHRVEIRGFGALSVKDYDSYIGRNPKTGEKIEVEKKCLPVWRTGLELKKRVDWSTGSEFNKGIATGAAS